jgi:hypothetical protein
MRRSIGYPGVCLAAFLLLSTPLLAQPQTPSITEFFIVWTNSPVSLPYANVTLSANTLVRPAPDQVKIIVNGVAVTALQVTLDQFAGGFTIKLDPSANIGDATKADISIPVQFTADGPPITLIKLGGDVLSPKQRQDAANAALQSATKDKTSDEKNIFVGLNVADPVDGAVEGDAEIHLNGAFSQFSQNLRMSANLRKSSAEKADSRQFDIGLHLEFNHNFLGDSVRSIQNAASAYEKDPTPSRQASLQMAIDGMQKRFWLAYSVDSAVRFEGDPTSFKVTNAVVDLPLQFISRTMNVLGSTDGWWFFRAMPAGFEGGQNLGSENPAKEKYTIARYKAGAAFGLFWKAPKQNSAFIKKVMLEAQGVDRYLFREESGFDPVSQTAISIADGNKYYIQADVKVYLASTPQGNYAFRASYARGGLPPIFADTKTFRYGFVFESPDKK